MTQPNSTSISNVEWLCGLLTIPLPPNPDDEESEPLQCIVWMIPDGPVLGSLTLESDQPLDVVLDHYHETTQKPLVGEPHEPTRIRVEHDDLARLLTQGIGSRIEVVHEPTPEFEKLLEDMTEYMRQQQPATPSYLIQDMTPEAMGGFFAATAELYRTKPWASLPADTAIVATIADLELQNAALIVMGQGQREFGFLLFGSTTDFAGFLKLAKQSRPSAPPPMPIYALDYSRGADIPPALRKEASIHEWAVADANAYPSLTVLNSQFTERLPTLAQLQQAEALSRALVRFTNDWRAASPDLKRQGLSATYTVATYAGEVAVQLALQPQTTTAGTTRVANARPRAATAKRTRRS